MIWNEALGLSRNFSFGIENPGRIKKYQIHLIYIDIVDLTLNYTDFKTDQNCKAVDLNSYPKAHQRNIACILKIMSRKN